MPDRYALMIGINSYPMVENANLRGCVNDVTLMASILEEHFGFPAENLRVLRDEEATEANVRGAMDELEERLGPDDVAVFFYAGHGSRVLVSRDPKLFNESIVPHDSGRGTHPNRDIHDEEIDAWVQRLNAKTPHVTLILDCCHSLVLTRDAFGESGRGIAADERLTPVFHATAVPAVEVAGRQSVVLVAACQGHEQAYEYRVYEGGRVLRHGAMTYFLSRALARTTGPVTWRQLFSTLQPALNAEYSRQHPQLWGRVDSLVFGTREVRSQAHLRLVEVGKDEVVLSGGAAHGVSEGSVWRIHEPHPTNAWASSAGLPELARVRIVSVAAATSTGRLVEPASMLAAGQWAFLEELRLPAPMLTVAAGDMPEEDAAMLESFLRDSYVLDPVADGASAQVRIRRLEPRGEPGPDAPCPALGPLPGPIWAAVGHDGRLAARTRPAVSPASLRDLVFDLERVATYRRLLAIENPERASRVDGRVELRMLRRSDGSFVDAAGNYGHAVFVEGDRAEFEIRNQHIEEVWVNLLQFGADGAVELLMPRNGHPTYSGGGVRLEPGQVLRVAADYYRQDPRFRREVSEGLPLHLPAGFPWAAEPGEDLDSGMLYLKLMVTLQSVGFEVFEIESSRSGALWHPLQKLVQLYWSGRGSRSFSPRGAPDMDWTTVTRAVELRRQ